VRLVGDARDEAERRHVAERAADEQNSGFAGARRGRQFLRDGNFHAAGNGRKTLFRAQLANTIVGIKGRNGDTQRQDHGNQTNQVSAHDNLLAVGRIEAPEMWGPLSQQGTNGRGRKFLWKGGRDATSIPAIKPRSGRGVPSALPKELSASAVRTLL